MSKKNIYGMLTLALIIFTIVVFTVIDKTNSVNLSFAIQIILILYLSKTIFGCVLYVKKQYEKQKYSDAIILNLGLIIFLAVNILRQLNLLFFYFGETSILDIYNNTLESFSYFAMITLPFIIILAVCSVISNIILIKREGFKYTNLLGIVFGILAVICTFSGRIIYLLTNTLQLDESKILVKRFIDISLNTVLSYYYCLVLATLYGNIMAAKHNPTYDKDFVIILGSKIRKDGSLTPLLKGRADRAITFARNQKNETNKDLIYIPSGGQGKDEVISEAEAIKNYLIENGISSGNIVVESNSKSTYESMKFSKEKINSIKKEGKIAYSTTNYHVFRSGVIANNEGIDCEGMGSNTKWYFYANALIREFIANLHSQRLKHFVLITSINIILLGLVLVGPYIYN